MSAEVYHGGDRGKPGNDACCIEQSMTIASRGHQGITGILSFLSIPYSTGLVTKQPFNLLTSSTYRTCNTDQAGWEISTIKIPRSSLQMVDLAIVVGERRQQKLVRILFEGVVAQECRKRRERVG